LAPNPSAGGAPVEPRAKSLSTGRKWLFRLAAVLLPLPLLAGVELLLRVGGYGYSTDFFKKATIGGQDYFVENDQFGLRFFPASLARVASPVLMAVKKAPGTIRIFILGESAALGDPRPNYGAGRYLETLLRARFPAAKFEVVNTAVTAINSHAILPIARECARHEGDVWIVYMGNNEMVGPFGAATVFGLQAPPLRLVRLTLMLKATRLGQLLGALGRKLRPGSSGPAEWHGMKMFLQNQVPPNDSRKEVVYRSFQQNLADILRAGLDSGARIVLSTVAVNLKDCPPFGSWPATNLPPADGAAFEKLCQEAAAARERGNLAEAASHYGEAAGLGPQSADAQYRLGECLLLLTNSAAAWQHLQLAVDTDTLPFRADSRINDSLKAAGRQFAGPSLVLCDAVGALASAAPAGVPGQESFFEHVHLNSTGNYLLGRAWAEHIQQQLAARLPPAAAAAWLSQEQCERLLGLTDWNRVSVLEEIDRRVQEPPFQHQLDNGQRLAALSNQISQCRARIASTPPAEAARIYETALAGAPEDYRLHENYAEFLEATHDRRATAERQKVCELIPHFYFPHYRLGLDLKEQGRLAEALQAFQQAAEVLPAFQQAGVLSPAQSEIKLELGIVYARQGQWETALGELERAHQLSPEDPHACLYAGEVLWKLKRPIEAIASLREAVRLRGGYWEAHYRLGEYLAQSDDVPGAAAEFEQVLRLQPGYVRAHLNLGVALCKLGRPKEGVEQFDEVLRLDPQNRQALEFKQQALNHKGPRKP
jgi:tetratricopeptide (TPR) repeat protein